MKARRVHSTDASRADRVADWLSDRVYNDREADHGALMGALGLWIAFFHANLGGTTWWHEVFSVLPAPIWACVLIGLGLGRVFRPVPAAALLSCFTFAFLGLLVALVRWEMTVTPLFFWLSYKAMKSYLRLMQEHRRAVR